MFRFQLSHFSTPTAVLSTVLAVTALLAGPAQSTAQSLNAEPLVRLTGHTAPQVLDGRAIRVNHYDPARKLRLVLAVQPPHMAEEEQFLSELQDRTSPNFHHYLSPEEWNARFAPSVEDEQKVVDWAQAQGLTVTHRFENRLLVDLEAPVGLIEKVFGVTISSYQVGDEVDFANDRDPQLPASLSGVVYSVQGLNNIQRMHGSRPESDRIKGPDYAPGPVYRESGSDKGDGDPVKFAAIHKTNNGPVANFSNGKLDPSDIYSSQTYNYAALQALGHCCNPHNDSGGSPPDSSIAIAGFGTFLGSDVAGFASAYGFSYNWNAIDVDGSFTCPTGQTTCPSGETTQDVEWSIATANNPSSSNLTAHVWSYQGANGNWSTYTDMYNFMLSDGHARVFSTSWSCTEDYGCPYNVIVSQHNIFNMMIGAGWTLIAASGDRGAADDCKSNLPPKGQPQLDPDAHTSVAYPASDFDFVAAGGTALITYTNGDFYSEAAWQGGAGIGSCASNNGGSGGGVSVYFGQPSWQSSLSNLGSMRLSPDISLNADGVGQNLFINGSMSGDANGTSVSAPEWAGFFAQENAYLAAIGSICGSGGATACEPIGNPNPYLYEEGERKNAQHNPFYDMISGCNSSDATTADKLKYFCTAPGYDLVTGWGSANMLQLAWALNWEIIPASGEPYITWTGPPTNKWYNTNQTVSWTIHDYEPSGSTPAPGIAGETQGWDSIPADPSSEPHGGSGNSFYSGPQFPNGSAGCLAFEPNGCSGGVTQGCHTAWARGWNNQGWSTAGSSNSGYPESYGPLCYDTVAPNFSVVLSPAAPNANGWYTGPVSITMTASDPGGSGASGVQNIYYGIGAAACQTTSTGGCVNTPTSFTVSTQEVVGLIAFAEDKAGNFSSVVHKTLAIDDTAPVTTAGFSGVLASGAYDNSVTIVLKATDNLSGVQATYYTLDGGAKSTYSGTLQVATIGTHTLDFWSVDNAGNAEKTNILTFQVVSSTTTVLTPSPNPSVNGQTVTLKASVTATDGGTPTGSVTFIGAGKTLGTATLSGGVATLTTTALPVGSDAMAAVYGGATGYLAGTSAAVTQVVYETTTTALTSSQTPSTYGSSITLTATVKPSISGTPTGSVTFYSGVTPLGTATLNSAGTASWAIATLAVGSDSLTAVYGGSTTYNSSSSPALIETVAKATSAVVLTSSLTKSSFDAPVTFTATVTSAVGTPTGIVTFLSNGARIGVGTLSAGMATLTTSGLAVGTNSITASYGGSLDFNTSTSSTDSIAVSAAPTTVALTSSSNPGTFGKSITFTAKVTPTTAGIPTGTVTFLANSQSIGTGTLTSGFASLTTSSLNSGTYAITATYAATTDYQANTSAPYSEVVGAAATATTLTSSANPSTSGEAVVFTATVTSTAGTPTGTVTFNSNGTSLGTGTLTSGVATLSTTALTTGTHSITAVYTATANFKASTSVAISQVTNAAAKPQARSQTGSRQKP
jgi:hypothetical protein